MARRRQNYRIVNTNPYLQVSVDWEALTLSITNPTPYVVYVNIGSSTKPSRAANSDIIAPFNTYSTDVGDARDFAVFVDNTLSPGLPFPLPVSVTISQGAASVQSPINTAVLTALATGYDAKILSTVGSTIVMFLPLEDTSGLAAVDIIAAQNWTYGATNVTLNQAGVGDNKPAVLFGGAAAGQITPGDPVLTYLKSHWNPDEGTMAIWAYLTAAKASDINPYTFCILGVDPGNYISVGKGAASKLSISTKRSSNLMTGADFTYAGDSWVHMAGTWSRSNNRFRWYANGVQIGADQALVGSWTTSAFTFLFTQIASQQNSQYTPGSLAKWWLAARELSPDEVASLSVLT